MNDAAFTDEPDDAFRRFLAEQRPTLLARARHLCRSRRADAEDLVQDTLERAWRARGRLRDGEASRGWLHSILANLFIDRARRWQRQPRLHPVDALELPATYH